jgi:hypothetical protein
MGLEIDGAVQQAPQPLRQIMCPLPYPGNLWS